LDKAKKLFEKKQAKLDSDDHVIYYLDEFVDDKYVKTVATGKFNSLEYIKGY